jgi:ribosomal protein S18 acetylase RimI-like enzyme
MNWHDPCEVLEWDSAFFGVKIARVLGEILTEEYAAEIDAWAVREGVKCVYFLARSDHQETVHLARLAGYELVESRMELEWKVHAGALAGGRLATEADVPVLVAMTRGAFVDSRFYVDGHFSRKKCDELYERWISESCQGRMAHAVVVVEDSGRVAGYVTCKREGRGGRIGLMGVDAANRGKGVGARLMQAAQAWFSAAEVEKVRVVTQGRNIASQRLYQRCGFLTHSVGLYYHKWF